MLFLRRGHANLLCIIDFWGFLFGAHIHLYVYTHTAVDRTLTGPHTELQLSLPSNTAQRCAQRAARCVLRAVLLLTALRAAHSRSSCCSLRCAQLALLLAALRAARRALQFWWFLLFSAIFGAKNGDFQNLLKDSKTRANLLFDSGIICGMEPKPCKCQTKNLKTRSCFARWEPKINGFWLSNSQKSMWIKYEPKSF